MTHSIEETRELYESVQTKHFLIPIHRIPWNQEMFDESCEIMRRLIALRDVTAPCISFMRERTTNAWFLLYELKGKTLNIIHTIHTVSAAYAEGEGEEAYTPPVVEVLEDKLEQILQISTVLFTSTVKGEV